jgi:hypothetical protein
MAAIKTILLSLLKLFGRVCSLTGCSASHRTPAMNQHRALYRVSIDRAGKLSQKSNEAACRIVNLTQEGVRLETALPVYVGELLWLSFDLTPDTPLRSEVEVIDVSMPYVGARFVDLSPANKQALTTFIEDVLDMNFGGM